MKKCEIKQFFFWLVNSSGGDIKIEKKEISDITGKKNNGGIRKKHDSSILSRLAEILSTWLWGIYV